MNNEIIVDGDYEVVDEDEEVLVSSCGREVLTTADLSDEDLALLEKTEMSEDHEDLNIELDKPKGKMTQKEVIDAINAAAKNGLISSKQKAKLKNELGVQKSNFTHKQESKSSKSKKRKQQKTARRKNRK